MNPQDKLDSSDISWKELFQIVSVKLDSGLSRKKAKVIIWICIVTLFVNIVSVLLLASFAYPNKDQVYSVPGDIVKAGYFTQFEESSTSLSALSVHDEQHNNWLSYIKFKLKYGKAVDYMKKEKPLNNENESSTSDKEEYIIDVLEDNKMAVSAYVAASKEANRDDTYQTKYTVLFTPDMNDIKVKPGDVILSVDGDSIKSREQVDYLTNNKILKELKVFRFGKELTLNSSLYSVSITAENEILDKRSLQEGLKLYDQRYTGDSAGLPIAVELYSKFVGDVIKGRKVAMTGTIDFEGNVGPIGGVTAKTVLADENGIDLMFVPFDSYDAKNYSDSIEVSKAIGSDMKIVPVKTLHEVIEYLNTH